MPNRVLRHKFQQRRILKVVAALKYDALMDHVWMRMQVSPKPFHVSRIQKMHGTAKRGVLNSLLEWKAKVVCRCRLLYPTFQFRPVRKSPLAGNCKLRVGQAKLRIEDCRIGRALKSRMKFPDSPGHLRITFGARLEQVLGLVLEMIEVRVGRKWFYGHTRIRFPGRLIIRMLAG